jgi:2-polyprenyl-6-methoxyphenol hydroxylase-like FAD-dependent oxidoreductase
MLELGELLLWTVYPIGMLPIITSSEQHTDIAKSFKPASFFALFFNNRVFLAGDAYDTLSPKAGQEMKTAVTDAHGFSFTLCSPTFSDKRES